MQSAAPILHNSPDVENPRLTEEQIRECRERVERRWAERLREEAEWRKRNTIVLPNGRVVTGGEGFQHLTPAQHRAYALEAQARAAKRRVSMAPTRSRPANTLAPRRAQSSGRPAARPTRTRRSSGSRGDPPEDDDGEHRPVRWLPSSDSWEPWEPPFGLWRLRVLHCRFMEWREGVGS